MPVEFAPVEHEKFVLLGLPGKDPLGSTVSLCLEPVIFVVEKGKLLLEVLTVPSDIIRCSLFVAGKGFENERMKWVVVMNVEVVVVEEVEEKLSHFAEH